MKPVLGMQDPARRIRVPGDIEKLATAAVAAAFEVHLALGPGLLESAYEICLYEELTAQGMSVDRQRVLPLDYRGRTLDAGYRVDLIVHDRLVVEVKATENLLPVHTAQLITYLRILHQPLGMLINFHVPRIREGIHRVLNLAWTPRVPMLPASTTTAATAP
jgi:iron complex transport system substrate-binding protein